MTYPFPFCFGKSNKTDTFKSTYQIMDELAYKWEDLSDIAQASIIELMAGKHQGNVFASLMANFDTAREALEVSANSAGSAMTEHAKWSESLEARLLKLKATWQSLAQSFMSSDFLKGLLNGVTGLVDGLDKLISTFGTLPTLLTAFTAFKSFSGGGFFRVVQDEATGVATGITNVFKQSANSINQSLSAINVKNGFRGFLDNNDINALRNYSNALNHGVSSGTAWNNCMANASDVAKEAAKSNEFLAKGLDGYIKSQAQAEISTMAQNKSLTNAKALIKEYQSGCKTCGMSQKEFASAVGKTNPQLATQLTTAKSANGAMAGYITSLVGAKVASIALQAATMALNMALTMGISALISWGISKLDEWIETSDELAERIDEVTSKYKEQHQALMEIKGDYNTSNESSMVNKYAELSKGVDGLGRNISLTADEYAEYQDIVNTIAGQIPTLVSGYDSQGNAILSCKGNVEELTKAYEDLIHAQNQEVVKNAGDIQKDFENTLSDADFKKNKNVAKSLEKMLNGAYSKEQITELLNKDVTNQSRTNIINALEEAGVETDISWYNTSGKYDEAIAEAVEQHPEVVKSIISNFDSEMQAASEEMKTMAQAALSDAIDISTSDYYGLSDAMKNIASNVVNGIDTEHYQNIIDSGQSVEEYINGILDKFNELEANGESKNLEAAFNLQTQFNNGEISYGEYISGIQKAEELIGSLGLEEEVENQIKLSLNTDEITDNYEALQTRLLDKYKEEWGITPSIGKVDFEQGTEEAKKKVEEFLDGLTASEYEVAVEWIANGEVDLSNLNIEDIEKYIERQAKINEALNFETSIEVDKTSLELLNTALSESASAMGLSEESIDSLKSKYADLEGYDISTLFERTANGVKLNREELAKLEKEYQDLNKSEVEEHLTTLTDEYNRLTSEIDKCSNASERAKLISEREGYVSQIQELAEYQSQLEGVTGAYQRWIDAQNAPEDYEGYQAVATGRESVEDEIGRGFISNATKEYIDLLSGEDLVGKTIDDYANAWENLDKKVGSTSYSIHDFFTVDDDGNITATGIDRFFEGMKKDFNGSVAKFNKDTKKWTYDFSEDNLKKIQDEWGMGIEAIELMLEAAASAGYDVDWGGIFDSIDLDVSDFETLVSVAESAQEAFNKLDGIDDVDFNFTATGVEEATSEMEKARSTYIDLITNDDGSVNLKAEGAEEMRVILSTLIIQKQQLEDSNIAINIDTSGLDESQQDIANAINAVKTFREKYKNLEIAVSTGEGIDTAKSELSKAMGELQTLGGEGVDIAAQLILGEGSSGEDLKAKVDSALSVVGEDKKISVGFKIDETELGTLNSQVLANFTPEATVKITGIDDALVGEYTSTEKTAKGKVKWENDDKLVVDFSNKKHQAKGTVEWGNDTANVKTTFKASGTVTWSSGNNVQVKVVQMANGTANANGTTGRAFKHGTWGIKGSGTALVGELGMETLVRKDKFYTIGDNGAEFIKYQQGDIIFNHKQTEELFKNGKVTSGGGRGRAVYTGSAFVEGNAFWNATAGESSFASDRKNGTSNTFNYNNINVYNNDKTSSSKSISSSSSSSSSKSSSSSESSEEAKEEFEETIDWIETVIDRIERAIDQLDTKANSTYRTWSERNTALANQISEVGDEIELQQKAYDRYMKEANSIGLSETYASKVRNGTIDIETIKDESLKEKIDDYRNYYEAALDCQDAILELTEAESELFAQRFENVQSQYDSILQGFEHTEAMLNEYISQAEEQGYIVSKKYYNALIENEKSNIAELKKQQADLIDARDEAVESGTIKKHSQEWYDMCASIDEVTQSIEESTTALLEFDNAMRDIDWSVFDLIQERISAISEEADFLIELMSNDKLFDDDGKLTSQGLATMGLHAQNYNSYMYAADTYGEEVSNLDAQIAKDPYDQELINRRNELLELQRESILAAEDEKNAIKDLVSEGIDAELSALEERIDLYNEAMDSAKDLYDYQKKVEEQSSEISDLRKQESAYLGDTSEEGMAKLQEIQVSLKEAESELEETEWDRYIEQQSQLLDTLYNEYELILNQRLDNIDYLLEGIIESINATAGVDGTITSALGSEGAIAIALSNNATSIKDTLASEANKVGITLSSAMNSIWNTGDGNAKSVLTMYGEDFKTKSTTIITTLNSIKSDIAAMVDDVDKDAKKNTAANKTTTSAKKNPTTSSTSTNTTTTNKTTSSGDGKPKVGDKVKFVSGQYYYDSQGKNPLGSKYQGKEVYITSINTKNWATHPYHISTGKKLGSGDLGWLKLNQLSGYASGKKNFLNDEVAWTQEGNKREFIVRPSDGAILTPVAKGDSVLNATASKNIWDMANSPTDFIKNNLGLDNANIPNGANVNNNYTQNLESIVFNLPNVQNYNELLSQMQKDKNFEKLILSMSIDRLAGKSSLAKGKAIR